MPPEVRKEFDDLKARVQELELLNKKYQQKLIFYQDIEIRGNLKVTGDIQGTTIYRWNGSAWDDLTS